MLELKNIQFISESKITYDSFIESYVNDSVSGKRARFSSGQIANFVVQIEYSNGYSGKYMVIYNIKDNKFYWTIIAMGFIRDNKGNQLDDYSKLVHLLMRNTLKKLLIHPSFKLKRFFTEQYFKTDGCEFVGTRFLKLTKAMS